MKNKLRGFIIAVLPLLWSCCLHAQLNLVPNYGFETAGDPCLYNTLSNWTTPSGPAGTPDLWSSTSCNPNYWPAYQGTNAAGFMTYNNFGVGNANIREYVSVKLNCRLIAGQTYTVKFRYSVAPFSDYVGNNLGLYISQNLPVSPAAFALISLTPTYNISGVIGAGAWQTYVANYVAVGGEQYLTFGNFYSDANSTFNLRPGKMPTGVCYMLLDAVEVLDLSDCENQLLIENTVYNAGATYEKVSNLIHAGYSVGIPTPDGYVAVQNTADVDYEAGRHIELVPGFSATPNTEGYFLAQIIPDNCNSRPLATADAGPDLTLLCGEEAIIGLDCSELGYTWSATPPAALTYLSSTTSCTPTIAVPPGVSQVTYTVTVTSEYCEEPNYDDVVVNIIGQPISIDVSTGTSGYGNPMGFGTADGEWKYIKYMFDPPFSPPQDVYSIDPAQSPYAAQLWVQSNNSNWVNPHQAPPAFFPSGHHFYEFGFNINDITELQNVRFEIDELAVDNEIWIYLNNNTDFTNPLPGVTNLLYTLQTDVQSNYQAMATPGALYGPFVTGMNKLQVRVNNLQNRNENSTHGFLLTGRVVSDCGQFGNQRIIPLSPPQQQAASPVSVIPNPGTGIFTVRPGDGAGNEIIDLQVTDVSGQVIYSEKVPGSREKQVDLQFAPAGVYILHIRTTAEAMQTVKVIKY